MSNVLKFDQPLMDLAGKPFLSPEEKEFTIGAMLAPALSGHNQGDPLKYFAWAVTIYNNGELILDKSDLKVLRDFVISTQTLNNLCKAQVLEILDK